ncbi:TIGR01620 family protein [Bradyrhizobium sp. LHD-71]|uniref:YcjF family protein n=1 Tax=Bradyrhizobium sp. LHD-71 TaxID=3072141 RepID=UPI00280FE939|nr:TIGR01620 family protein [Bradyrhizobium sp. LHD-71]MDQ8730105.1 TIGR01620 family protein [Bradyrhizobium sp. LHD-71]
MTDQERRRPAAFRLDDPGVTVTASPEDARPSSAGGVRVLTEADAFAAPAAIEPVSPPTRKGMRWGALFWSALGGLVALGAGLAVTRLIEDLFARAEGLGWIGAALAALAGVALLVIVGRELFALLRLAAIEKLHARAAAVLISDDRDEARAVAAELIRLAKENPHLARGRTVLTQHVDDIIDGADLVRLAERELMAPLDDEARRLISQAAQRVSVVTAVSPRAAIDMIFVLISALRLIRQLAKLYGGRPGWLGLARLFRQAVAHLAVTGSVAISDGLIQQALGHGLASRLSAKLGEGVLNGFLTARLGLAAMDVIRPLPFAALPRPALSDLIKDLTRGRDEAA